MSGTIGRLTRKFQIKFVLSPKSIGAHNNQLYNQTQIMDDYTQVTEDKNVR
jgi:hypothetical protein